MGAENLNSSDRTTVVFPEGRGSTSWERRHADGAVPDRWPYGLDKLHSHLGHVVSREASALAPMRLLRFLLQKRAEPANARSMTVTWEEDVALRAVYQFPSDAAISGVIWATDATTPRDLLKKALTRAVLRRMNLVWVLSPSQVPQVRRWLGSGGPIVRYLRFGVDEEFFPFSPLPAEPLIVSAGGDRDRDPATLFRALEIVRARRPEVRAFVQTTTTLRPPEGVTVVPRMTHAELRDLYSRATAVVICTRKNEHASGMTVALEAMSTGRPVVISDTPGIDDYVVDGVTGFLVSPGEPRDVAMRLLQLVDEPGKAADLGSAGRQRVESHFTSRRMASDVARFVRDVIPTATRQQ
jgi:glycosyltransferase involved in cell wall biosynthesis